MWIVNGSNIGPAFVPFVCFSPALSVSISSEEGLQDSPWTRRRSTAQIKIRRRINLKLSRFGTNDVLTSKIRRASRLLFRLLSIGEEELNRSVWSIYWNDLFTLKRADKLSEIDTNNGFNRSIVEGVRLHVECVKLLIVFRTFVFYKRMKLRENLESLFWNFSQEMNRCLLVADPLWPSVEDF